MKNARRAWLCNRDFYLGPVSKISNLNDICTGYFDPNSTCRTQYRRLVYVLDTSALQIIVMHGIIAKSMYWIFAHYK